MAHTKPISKLRPRRKAVPVVGVAGMSLSLATGASAATAVPAADVPSWDTSPPQVTLSEEEIADVSLGTFYVFDRKTPERPDLAKDFPEAVDGGGGAEAAAEAAAAVVEAAVVEAAVVEAAAVEAAVAVCRGEFAASARPEHVPNVDGHSLVAEVVSTDASQYSRTL